MTRNTFNIQGALTEMKFPSIMGVINVTPDSFYAGSRQANDDALLHKADEMVGQGASILDIGGHSTRPGAEALEVDQELNRVLPVIRSLKKHLPQTLLSIDTFQAEVARAALEEGADIINDISGGQFDPKIYQVAAHYKAPYILGHLQGSFANMMSETSYEDLIGEVNQFFVEKSNHLRELGVYDIIVDPGFGFSKTLEQNYLLLKNMGYFTNLGMPMLAGLSRKSMIWKLLDIKPDEALNGTTVLNTMALLNGASILRVHDVREAIETVRLFNQTYD